MKTHTGQGFQSMRTLRGTILIARGILGSSESVNVERVALDMTNQEWMNIHSLARMNVTGIKQKDIEKK